MLLVDAFLSSLALVSVPVAAGSRARRAFGLVERFVIGVIRAQGR